MKAGSLRRSIKLISSSLSEEEKRDKTQINNVRNERADNIGGSTDIKRRIREYHK